MIGNVRNRGAILGAALAAWLCAAALPATAIPIQVHEQDVSLTVPDGFEEMTPLTNDPEVVRLFVRRPAGTEAPDTWLSIRRGGSNVNAVTDWQPGASGSQVLGRYSERPRDLDIAVLQTQAASNEAVIRQSQARLPSGDTPYRLDLRSRTMEDQEMKAIMRSVLASAARQQEGPPKPSFNGWGAMFLCLTLGAALIVIAMGRR